MKLPLLTALALVAGCLGSAAAQQSGSPPGGPGGSVPGPGMMGGYGMGGYGMGGYGAMGPGYMGPHGPAMCTAMASHIEGRLAYVKAELKITESQEPLWQSFANAARANAQAMLAHCSAMTARPSSGALSPPERLEQHEQFMAAQLDALRGMGKALKPLYAALDASQKRDADELFSGPMGMM